MSYLCEMLRPGIADYLDALDNPRGLFRTLGEVRVERDVYGQPDFIAGNSAAVFRHAAPDGRWRVLKCYIRPNPHLRAVYRYVERHAPPLLPAVRLLPDEMFVFGFGWVDVVEGEWIAGVTLAAAARRAVKNGGVEELAGAFDALWERLRAGEWAHGDLKPENIIVTGDGMRLVDCDAMWIPELRGLRAAELGTPPWSVRAAGDFDKSIDDGPTRLISGALHALADDPVLCRNFTTLEDVPGNAK